MRHGAGTFSTGLFITSPLLDREDREEECERVVAGTAFRYASEVMLLLPTLKEAEVRCLLAQMDGATGRATEVELLSVKFDYDKLAPLQMPELDPHAALTHFPHQENIKDAAASILAGASE